MASRKHIARSLRFTLSAVYTGLFTLLLLGVGLLFRHNLGANLDEQARDDIKQSWDVLKANLRIENDTGQANYHPVWFFDTIDPDEASARARIQSVYVITDEKGKPLPDASSPTSLSLSPTYESLGSDTPAQVRLVLASNQAEWVEKKDPDGVPYLIRQSYVLSEDRKHKYFVAIGKSFEESAALLRQFDWLCVGLFPLVILTGFATGWYFTGRSLTPVLEIAQAAQHISGSNLSLRIPSRRTGDELDYLAETFNQMIERLEMNFNQVRQFSTDVSHELRTPITIVRGQLEVALLTANTAEQYRDAIVDSLQDIERLSQIVRALLLLSQAETGQVILQKQALDLVEVAEGIVDQFQIPAEGADLDLKFIANIPRCPGEFDRIQIERMLSNLLSNAIKFTPPGGQIRVTVGREEDEAEIVVADTGQGIPPEHLPLIFDRFYRVRGREEQSSPEKGLGLGLSFVSWIVRAHGGTVEARSGPGKGTSFRIRLPLGSGVTAEAPPQETPGEVMKQV
ncbi:MAG: heavy metal sensor histidine kinase [Acidobacteriota bacterium]